MLLRSKKSQTAQERIDKVLQGPIFHLVRDKPHLLAKVRARAHGAGRRIGGGGAGAWEGGRRRAYGRQAYGADRAHAAAHGAAHMRGLLGGAWGGAWERACACVEGARASSPRRMRVASWPRRMQTAWAAGQAQGSQPQLCGTLAAARLVPHGMRLRCCAPAGALDAPNTPAPCRPPFQPKVTAIAGDLSLPGLGISAADHATLVDKVDILIHSAADIRLEAPILETMRANYVGTQRVLQLALQLRRWGRGGGRGAGCRRGARAGRGCGACLRRTAGVWRTPAHPPPSVPPPRPAALLQAVGHGARVHVLCEHQQARGHDGQRAHLPPDARRGGGRWRGHRAGEPGDARGRERQRERGGG